MKGKEKKMGRRSKQHGQGQPENVKKVTCFVCDREVPKRKTKLMGKHGRACRKCLDKARAGNIKGGLTREEELDYGGAGEKNKSVAHGLMKGIIRKKEEWKKEDEKQKRTKKSIRKHRQKRKELSDAGKQLQTYAMMGALLAEDMKAIKEAGSK